MNLNNSNNFSTKSNQTTDRDILYEILNTTDNVFRYFSVIVHLAFILVLVISSEIRTRNLLYVNHATVISIAYPILLFGFGNSTANSQSSQFLCTFIGYYRDFTNFTRPFSILIIAVYRYFGVFHINLYKRLNNNNLLLIMPIIMVWFLSIAFPITINKALNTSVMTMLCLNGNSDSRAVSIVYFVINYIVLLVVPNFVTVFFYVRIMLELKRIKSRVWPIKPSLKIATVAILKEPNVRSLMLKKTNGLNYKNEKTFAKHFLLMCTSVILTTSGFCIFYLNNIIPDYFNVLRYWLPVQRVVLSIGVSLVPITSLYFHPGRFRIVRKILTKFFNK